MQGTHTSEVPKQEPPKQTPPPNLTLVEQQPGKETYSTKPAVPVPIAAPAQPPPPPIEQKEQEDDLAASVPEGTVCKRSGCGKTFVNDEVSRHGDGPEATCTYHPKAVSNNYIMLG